nr:hypothetical protein [Mucilaginibacter sp. E4BP6]
MAIFSVLMKVLNSYLDLFYMPYKNVSTTVHIA